MRVRAKVLLSVLFTCFLAMAASGQTSQDSSMGLYQMTGNSEHKNSDRLFYLVDDFSELYTVPGFTFGAPTGLVPGAGVAFAGVSGITSSRTDTDGAVSAGMGWGDPMNSIGGAVSLGIGSIDPSDGGAFNRGSLNVSLGHTFTEYGFGAAIGVTNVDLWHKSRQDRVDESLYAALTQLLPNDIAPIIITAGVGNNGYTNINRGLTADQRKDEVDFFAAGAVYLIPQVSLILDYTSGMTTLGTSIVPFPDYPITIGLAAQDLSKQLVEDEVKFLGTIGAGYAF
jgi:hypothetical protein